jgi:shikimate kinase
MGAGKSTVAAELATRFSLPHRDTDAEIARVSGLDISTIFVEKGEEYFRALEKDVLRSELLGEPSILSLGGGACISADSQSALRACGAFIVYLEISLAHVVERIGFNRDRPLLLSNPRAQWQSLMNERAPIYSGLADVTINVDGKDVASICDEIEVAFELRTRGAER